MKVIESNNRMKGPENNDLGGTLRELGMPEGNVLFQPGITSKWHYAVEYEAHLMLSQAIQKYKREFVPQRDEVVGCSFECCNDCDDAVASVTVGGTRLVHRYDCAVHWTRHNRNVDPAWFAPSFSVKEMYQQLWQVVFSVPLREIYLRSSYLKSHVGVATLAQALRKNQTMTKLVLEWVSGCPPEQKEHLSYLALHALHFCPSLRSIHVWFNFNSGKRRREQFLFSLRFATSSLEEVKMVVWENDNIETLVESLECNHNIRNLFLVGRVPAPSTYRLIDRLHATRLTSLTLERLPEPGLISLAGQLHSNRVALRGLDVSRSTFTLKASAAFVQALQENTSLERLNVSKAGIDLEQSLCWSQGLPHFHGLRHLTLEDNPFCTIGPMVDDVNVAIRLASDGDHRGCVQHMVTALGENFTLLSLAMAKSYDTTSCAAVSCHWESPETRNQMEGYLSRNASLYQNTRMVNLVSILLPKMQA